MPFLTQTKWPFPVVLGLIAVLFVLENRKILTADQVQWFVGALALGGAQAGIHTDKPEPKEAPQITTRITIPPKGES